MNLHSGLVGTVSTALMNGKRKLSSLQRLIYSWLFSQLFVISKVICNIKLWFNFGRGFALETTHFSVVVARFSSYW